MISRPQPLGVLPLPAGWLVLPAEAVADPAGAAVRDALMVGDLPPAWPLLLRALELAVAGDIDGAAAAVDPEHAYNHFVLTGEPSSLARAATAGDPPLAALVAVAAYSLGHGPAGIHDRAREKLTEARDLFAGAGTTAPSPPSTRRWATSTPPWWGRGSGEAPLMELHERAQFDFLLNTAAERFVERLVQRTGGLVEGLAALRADPQGDGVWLDEFVRAVLRDFLLDNTAGAAFVLGNCEKRTLEGGYAGTVAQVLGDLAVRALADVLASKVDQGIELAFSGHLG